MQQHNNGNQQALATGWSAYKRTAAAARAEAGAMRAWRWRVLSLTLAGAALSTAADSLPWPASVAQWLQPATGGAGAVALALAAVISATVISAARNKRWTQNRAVAEALKSECLRFATGVTPYNDVRPADILLDRVKQLGAKAGGSATLHPGSARAGAPVVPMSVADYLEKRLNEQVTWYRGKAGAAQATLQRWRTASVVLGLAAAGLSVLGNVFQVPGPAAWVAVLSTATTAIGSYVYAERFAFVAQSYTTTANQLELLSARWHASAGTTANAQQLIDGAERVMAAENTGWMAELLREDAQA